MAAACWKADTALWMSLITYTWGMLHMSESCHMCAHLNEWKRPLGKHVPPCEWVISVMLSHMNEPCCIWVHMNEWKLPIQNHIPPSNGVSSRMYEACRTRMSHVTCNWTWMRESSLRKLPLQNHIPLFEESHHLCMSHVTYEWVISQIDESRQRTTLQQARTHYNTLQHTATQRKWVDDTKEKKRRGIMEQTMCAEPCLACGSLMARGIPPLCLLTDYNMLQHTTTRCKTLQHTATHTSCDKGYFKRTATQQPLSTCCPGVKKIVVIKPKSQSRIGETRSEAAHKIYKEPCLACGAHMLWLHSVGSLCIVMTLLWMILFLRGSFANQWAKVSYSVLQFVAVCCSLM